MRAAEALGIFLVFFLVGILVRIPEPCLGAQPDLVLATTTSIQDSGLLDGSVCQVV